MTPSSSNASSFFAAAYLALQLLPIANKGQKFAALSVMRSIHTLAKNT